MKIRLLRFLFPILLFCILADPIAAKPPTDAEIKTDLQARIDKSGGNFAIVIGIIDEHGTRIISSGKLDNGTAGKVDGDTLFEIDSVTKTFTTLLLADMVQRGELKLDDPISKFLPSSVKAPTRKGRGIHFT